MKVVSSFSGVESISIDMERKLTVIGDDDPVVVVSKLRKLWHTEIVMIGPTKELEKKKKEPKKDDEEKQIAYEPCMSKYYYVHSEEKNPNACVVKDEIRKKEKSWDLLFNGDGFELKPNRDEN